MIRFLSLHGDMTGSARINEQRSGVEVCLKLRSRMNSALQAFITDGKRIAAIRIVDGCGTGEYMNVRGLLVCGEGGELLAFGSVDMGRAEAEEFRTKVRFILNAWAEKRRFQQPEYARRQQTAGPKQGEGAGRAEKPKPESPATAEILERAEQLFRGGVQTAKKPAAAEAEQEAKPMGKYPEAAYTERAEQLFRGGVQAAKKPDAAEAEQAAKPMGKYPDTAHTEREAVENPFPSFFENSYWWREVNDNTRIFGVANIRGIKYRIVAVRSNAKYPPRGMGRNARRLISSGGKRYWVGLWKMQQM
ncbi:MAG: hypothetical protein SPI37_04390 [Eubacteriales bacterium]|nr:hypothetical protein [Eubacteriales bacterium]